MRTERETERERCGWMKTNKRSGWGKTRKRKETRSNRMSDGTGPKNKEEEGGGLTLTEEGIIQSYNVDYPLSQ